MHWSALCGIPNYHLLGGASGTVELVIVFILQVGVQLVQKHQDTHNRWMLIARTDCHQTSGIVSRRDHIPPTALSVSSDYPYSLSYDGRFRIQQMHEVTVSLGCSRRQRVHVIRHGERETERQREGGRERGRQSKWKRHVDLWELAYGCWNTSICDVSLRNRFFYFKWC